MWTVLILDQVDGWYDQLTDSDPDAADAVDAALDVLKSEGPTLGRPVADRIHGSKFHNMKELRPLSTKIRILYIFDPERRAVLLAAGDKEGNWERWYTENIRLAEKRYAEHLKREGLEE